ncbi:MAG: hypothetical protein KC657_35150 [Myxococcales bacterium]|nr:hypothetical protein [Myxococcales bacterium]
MLTKKSLLTLAASLSVLALAAGCSSSAEEPEEGEETSASAEQPIRSTASAEACIASIAGNIAWCRNVPSCIATVAATCSTCSRGCVTAIVNTLVCKTTRVTGRYPDGSCCTICQDGTIDICDPGVCRR